MNLHGLLKTTFAYHPQFTGEVASQVLRSALERDKATMVARFGANEIKASLLPILPAIVQPFLQSNIYSMMSNNAGFFPANKITIQQFSDLMIEDMKQIDVLGSWRIEERLLLRHFPNAKRVALNSLEPYLSENPWSEALAGKKVLVIHPFNVTIERQYNDKRAFMFKDPRVLPVFKSLETIKAVQTVAGQESEFADWFEALDSMKAAIDVKDFDVAIIGCGAYGFPLAAHVKRMGKKAIHMGGATQLLFGIKGKRWDKHPRIGALFNEYWVRPAPEDVPQQANKVEGGCYW
jgi:hypothetical protein